MLRSIAGYCADDRQVCRFVGGSLIADLSLAENIQLEPALSCSAVPVWLWSELNALFHAANSPIPDGWVGWLPAEATPVAQLQAQVGRALAADPDWFLIDAETWPDDVLSPERFTSAFQDRYPWRALTWHCASETRARDLHARLHEPMP